MVSDAETIIAYIFKRSGKSEIEYSEIYLTLSMDLNWFSPDDAKAFINKAVEKKLLKKTNEIIIPCFDINNIKVPLGFYPSKMLFKDTNSVKNKKEEKNIFTHIIKKIEDETEISEEERRQLRALGYAH